MPCKGIILAGGAGTRLHPLTHGVSKQLMPVYDKPMIYYPLSVLMLGGITDMLIITAPEDETAFQRVLGDGSQWGISLRYAVQREPEGLPQAFVIGEEFIDGQPVCMALGDNIFYGDGLPRHVRNAAARAGGATVFSYHVKDPERYGVLVFDADGKVRDIVEKPVRAPSRFVLTGMYVFDHRVSEFARELKPSARGETEITDLIRRYLQEDSLTVEMLGRGMAWLDTGTHDSLLDAANFVRVVEERQGTKISCPEEIAYRMGYIDAGQLQRLADGLTRSGYGQYLHAVLEEGARLG